MTKQQKVADVNNIVTEARKHYTWQEFADMVTAVWQALDTAETKAVDGDPK